MASPGLANENIPPVPAPLEAFPPGGGPAGVVENEKPDLLVAGVILPTALDVFVPDPTLKRPPPPVLAPGKRPPCGPAAASLVGVDKVVEAFCPNVPPPNRGFCADG